MQELIFPGHILAEIVDCCKRMPTSMRDKDKGLLYSYLILSNYQPRKAGSQLYGIPAYIQAHQRQRMSSPLEIHSLHAHDLCTYTMTASSFNPNSLGNLTLYCFETAILI